MCYGFDGGGALRASLEKRGASRRGLLRGAMAGTAGLAVAGATGIGAPAAAATAADNGRHGRGRQVPEDRISIQMWTLRWASRTDWPPPEGTTPSPYIGWEKVLERLAQYRYPRIERALGLFTDSAATEKAKLDEVGIWASSSHDGISADWTAFQKKLDDANTFEQRYINVPFLNAPTDSTDPVGYWKSNAEKMNIEASAARRRGLYYGYHNHAHEFTTVLPNGKTPWDILSAELDPRLVHFEIDLYWAFRAGVETGAADPHQFAMDVINDSRHRVRQYHVKDMSSYSGRVAQKMCDLGVGVIDFPRIFANHKVEEYIVENDQPDAPNAPLATAAVGKLYLEHTSY